LQLGLLERSQVMRKRRTTGWVAVALGLTACSGGGDVAAQRTQSGTPASGDDIGEEKSDLARLPPDASDDAVATLVTNNTAFAFALNAELPSRYRTTVVTFRCS
jgi:hypothetical protein